MRPSASAILAALVGLCVAGCTVDRTGLFVVDGGTTSFDGGPVDLGVETDATEVDVGNIDLGGGDLGGADLGPDDLGPTDLGSDLGPTDLGPAPCVDSGVRSHRSCRERRDDACLLTPPASGLYDIDVDGAGLVAPVQVYCDMSIAGGGWTLIARTYSGITSFGWGTLFGAVDMDLAHYSLGLGGTLEFTEVLVGVWSAGKSWGGNPVYRFTVPGDFVATHATTAYAITDLTVVQGPCAPAPGEPRMLRYVGHTSATDHFFFGDTAALAATGLRPYVFSLVDNTCATSGSLGMRHGMIMVR